MADNTERYYADMESERHNSATGYFNARPHLDTPANRDMFNCGFERAFKLLWRPPECFNVYAPTQRCQKPKGHTDECGPL